MSPISGNNSNLKSGAYHTKSWTFPDAGEGHDEVGGRHPTDFNAPGRGRGRRSANDRLRAKTCPNPNPGESNLNLSQRCSKFQCPFHPEPPVMPEKLNNAVKFIKIPMNKISGKEVVWFDHTLPLRTDKEGRVTFDPTQPCICNRPPKVMLARMYFRKLSIQLRHPFQIIFCNMCGFTAFGRVQKKCQAHPYIKYLLDLEFCGSCRSLLLEERNVNSKSQ